MSLPFGAAETASTSDDHTTPAVANRTGERRVWRRVRQEALDAAAEARDGMDYDEFSVVSTESKFAQNALEITGERCKSSLYAILPKVLPFEQQPMDTIAVDDKTSQEVDWESMDPLQRLETRRVKKDLKMEDRSTKSNGKPRGIKVWRNAEGTGLEAAYKDEHAALGSKRMKLFVTSGRVRIISEWRRTAVQEEYEKILKRWVNGKGYALDSCYDLAFRTACCKIEAKHPVGDDDIDQPGEVTIKIRYLKQGDSEDTGSYAIATPFFMDVLSNTTGSIAIATEWATLPTPPKSSANIRFEMPREFEELKNASDEPDCTVTTLRRYMMHSRTMAVLKRAAYEVFLLRYDFVEAKRRCHEIYGEHQRSAVRKANSNWKDPIVARIVIKTPVTSADKADDGVSVGDRYLVIRRNWVISGETGKELKTGLRLPSEYPVQLEKELCHRISERYYQTGDIIQGIKCGMQLMAACEGVELGTDLIEELLDGLDRSASMEVVEVDEWWITRCCVKLKLGSQRIEGEAVCAECYEYRHAPHRTPTWKAFCSDIATCRSKSMVLKSLRDDQQAQPNENSLLSLQDPFALYEAIRSMEDRRSGDKTVYRDSISGEQLDSANPNRGIRPSLDKIDLLYQHPGDSLLAMHTSKNVEIITNGNNAAKRDTSLNALLVCLQSIRFKSEGVGLNDGVEQVDQLDLEGRLLLAVAGSRGSEERQARGQVLATATRYVEWISSLDTAIPYVKSARLDRTRVSSQSVAVYGFLAERLKDVAPIDRFTDVERNRSHYPPWTPPTVKPRTPRIRKLSNEEQDRQWHNNQISLTHATSRGVVLPMAADGTYHPYTAVTDPCEITFHNLASDFQFREITLRLWCNRKHDTGSEVSWITLLLSINKSVAEQGGGDSTTGLGFSYHPRSPIRLSIGAVQVEDNMTTEFAVPEPVFGVASHLKSPPVRTICAQNRFTNFGWGDRGPEDRKGWWRNCVESAKDFQLQNAPFLSQTMEWWGRVLRI